MQNATQPDMDKLISGGQQRRRRRNLTRAGGAALAVVLLGFVAYAVTRGDSIDADPTGSADTPSDTSAPSTDEVPPTLSLDGGNLEPGTYRLLVGADTTGAAIEADITVDGEGWESGNFPVAETGGIHGGLAVYEPSAIAAGTGCSGDTPNADLGETPQSLAEQLAQLPQSTVVQPVTPTDAYGHGAFHLRLRVADDCPQGQAYRVAETPRASHGISYSLIPETVVLDFWVLDLDGESVVVEAWHQSDASADLVDQIARATDSVTFVTGS